MSTVFPLLVSGIRDFHSKYCLFSNLLYVQVLGVNILFFNRQILYMRKMKSSDNNVEVCVRFEVLVDFKMHFFRIQKVGFIVVT